MKDRLSDGPSTSRRNFLELAGKVSAGLVLSGRLPLEVSVSIPEPPENPNYIKKEISFEETFLGEGSLGVEFPGVNGLGRDLVVVEKGVLKVRKVTDLEGNYKDKDVELGEENIREAGRLSFSDGTHVLTVKTKIDRLKFALLDNEHNPVGELVDLSAQGDKVEKFKLRPVSGSEGVVSAYSTKADSYYRENSASWGWWNVEGGIRRFAAFRLNSGYDKQIVAADAMPLEGTTVLLAIVRDHSTSEQRLWMKAFAGIGSANSDGAMEVEEIRDENFVDLPQEIANLGENSTNKDGNPHFLDIEVVPNTFNLASLEMGLDRGSVWLLSVSGDGDNGLIINREEEYKSTPSLDRLVTTVPGALAVVTNENIIYFPPPDPFYFGRVEQFGRSLPRAVLLDPGEAGGGFPMVIPDENGSGLKLLVPKEPEEPSRREIFMALIGRKFE